MKEGVGQFQLPNSELVLGATLVGGTLHFPPSAEFRSFLPGFFGTLVPAFHQDISQAPFCFGSTSSSSKHKHRVRKTYTTSTTLGELKRAVGEEKTRAILEGKGNVVASCGSGKVAGGLDFPLRESITLHDEVRPFAPVCAR